MTDESEQPKETTEQAGGQQAPLSGSSDFTTGEGLVALAGMVLVANWVLFDVFLDEFGLAFPTLLFAVMVVIVPRLDRETVEKVAPVPVIMKVGGYAVAVAGLISVISDLESGFFEGALTIIGALIAYVAFAMAFFGARSVDI